MEVKQKSLKLNFIMNALLTMSSFVFPLIAFPYVSRILLPIGTGKVAFANSLISYFNIFAQLGIPTYGIRSCAMVRDDKERLTRTAHELLAINLIMSVISYVMLSLALLFVPRLRNERTLYIIVSFTILLTAIGMEWIYKALEQYTYIAIRSIVFKFIALLAMFLLIHKQSDYVIYGGLTILAASASNVLNFANVHKYIDMKSVGGYHIRRHLKPTVTFFAVSCAITVYTQLDTVMLGFMAADADVGYYNVVVKIKMILASIVTSLGTVLLPRASYYIQNNRMDDFKRIIRKAINFIFLLACPLMLYFILFARECIYILSGSAYESSIVPMQIIMLTLLLIGITNMLGIQVLVPMGKEKVVLYSTVAGGIVDITLNMVLIPHYVSAGAAVGTLAAEVVVLIVQYYALRHEVSNVFKKICYFRIGIALAFGSAASLWIKIRNLGDFFTLLISAPIFFGVYVLVLFIAKEPLVSEIFHQAMERLEKIKNNK